jgi:uncharacterized membrane protein
MADSTEEQRSSRSEILPAEHNPADPLSPEVYRVAASLTRSGPLPDSRELANYEKILPGAADRIITVFEKQADHRMEIEKSVILGGVANERYGIAAGVIVVVSTLIAAGYMARIGMGGWGISVVLAEIAGIVYAVHRIARTNSDERKRKSAKQEKLDEK